MQMNPYVFFNGDCATAFRFYEQVFDGKITSMTTYGNSPAAQHVPAEWHEKVLHARLEFDGQAMLASDAGPGRFEQPQGFSICLNVADLEMAERIFAALENGGKVEMPFAKTFWSKGFGQLVDKFGIPWMINCG